MTGLEFLILALAAYRVWKLVAEDSILLGPRAWVFSRFSRDGKPGRLQEWASCPWCAGFWISLAWALAFWADHRAIWAAVPFALSAVVGLAYSTLERLDAYEDSLGD